MAVKLNEKFLEGFVSAHEMENIRPAAESAYRVLKDRSGPGNDFLGWMDLPVNYDKEEFARIKVAAKKIQRSCDILVVLGIGGSYLGARAAIEFVKSPLYNNLKKDTPDIYFSGNNISTTALTELLSICEGRDICINVISKSGTTTETAIAFRVFRDLLIKKYGEDGARERIFVTTDKCRGTLKKFSDESGYETFVVPDDVGGRFSVLTAVGLLPIATAGIDIDALMQGAADARVAFSTPDLDQNDALRYAAIRTILSRKGEYRGCLTEGDLLWALKNMCNMDMRQAESKRIMDIHRRKDHVPVRITASMHDLIERASHQNFVPVVDDYGAFIGLVTRKAIIKYCNDRLFPED